MTVPQKPLLYLVRAEQRIIGIAGRDFKAEPWLEGEGARFFTPARIAQMAADNEALRQRRKGRK